MKSKVRFKYTKPEEINSHSNDKNFCCGANVLNVSYFVFVGPIGNLPTSETYGFTNVYVISFFFLADEGNEITCRKFRQRRYRMGQILNILAKKLLNQVKSSWGVRCLVCGPIRGIC